MNIPRMIVQFGIPGVTVFFLFFELIVPLILKHRPRGQMRRQAAKLFVFLMTIMLAATYPEVIHEPLTYQIRGVFGEGMFFQVDLMNFPLLILAGILWLLVGYFSREDIHYLFYTVVYLSTIGTLMAGDLLSFFLFFEIMTFTSYALMVYHRGEEQLEAGAVYIYMGIIGGLLVLAGLLLLVTYTGSLQWTHLAETISDMGFVKYLIAGFLLAGFGVKAAVMPFHFWMAPVYEKAPYAVVALSSGLLIKVGAFGMMKVLFITFSAAPAAGGPSAGLLSCFVSQRMGMGLIWLGLISMSFGALAALMQSQLKRLLAYSSISQMGYIVTGIGVASYLSYEGALGFTGSLYHMLNHAFFKTLWILVAATVYFSTKETNMYRLGSLSRKMPLTFFFALVAILGITGMPGLNGYASKTVLHHGLVQAAEQGHVSLQYAEFIFKAASVGTVTYAFKFIYHVFLKSFSTSLIEKPKYPGFMNASMAILAGLILFIGLFPGLMLDYLLVPAALSFHFDAQLIDTKIAGMHFWQWKDLSGSFLVYAAGILLLVSGLKLHLFRLKPPRWVSAEKFLYHPIIHFCDRFSRFCVRKYETPIIFGDALIYAIVLVFIMLMLILNSVAG